MPPGVDAINWLVPRHPIEGASADDDLSRELHSELSPRHVLYGIKAQPVARRQDRLSIAIENPRDADAPVPNRRGLGLDNVRQRLVAMFGPDARLETRTDPGRFRVELALPCFTDD